MIIIVHGGAGSKKPSKKRLEELKSALETGFRILKEGGPALDAVAQTISQMEDSGVFNAGLGSNLQLDGVRRLDASIMDGSDLNAGSVIGLEGFKNPIKAARLVMDLTHKVLTNRGAGPIAGGNELELLPLPDEGALKRLEEAQGKKSDAMRLYEKYFSTVGAVALDSAGNLAAGSSTGGIPAMLPGRVGDTPLIGAGVYAENLLGAVSCTGKGEDIIRLCLAKEVCMNMRAKNPMNAVEASFKRLKRFNGAAGVIALNMKGQPVILHTTEYMPAGIADKSGIIVKEAFTRFE